MIRDFFFILNKSLVELLLLQIPCKSEWLDLNKDVEEGKRELI